MISLCSPSISVRTRINFHPMLCLRTSITIAYCFVTYSQVRGRLCVNVQYSIRGRIRTRFHPFIFIFRSGEFGKVSQFNGYRFPRFFFVRRDSRVVFYHKEIIRRIRFSKYLKVASRVSVRISRLPIPFCKNYSNSRGNSRCRQVLLLEHVRCRRVIYLSSCVRTSVFRVFIVSNRVGLYQITRFIVRHCITSSSHPQYRVSKIKRDMMNIRVFSARPAVRGGNIPLCVRHLRQPIRVSVPRTPSLRILDSVFSREVRRDRIRIIYPRRRKGTYIFTSQVSVTTRVDPDHVILMSTTWRRGTFLLIIPFTGGIRTSWLCLIRQRILCFRVNI